MISTVIDNKLTESLGMHMYTFIFSLTYNWKTLINLHEVGNDYAIQTDWMIDRKWLEAQTLIIEE